MTKIPLGIPKHFQLWYNSFFILSKTIVLRIIRIGQVIKKIQTWSGLWPEHDPCPRTRLVSIHLNTTRVQGTRLVFARQSGPLLQNPALFNFGSKGASFVPILSTILLNTL
jgi:hypothetical protein